MNWTVILDTVVTLCLGGLGWVIRRGWLKYERALVAAEKARRDAAEKELTQLRVIVAGVHEAMSKLTHNQAELKKFLGNWSKELVEKIGDTLKLGQQDAEKLAGVLTELNLFLAFSKDSDETAVKQIGKNTFLVHKKKEG